MGSLASSKSHSPPVKITLNPGTTFKVPERGYFINKAYAAKLVVNASDAVRQLRARVTMLEGLLQSAQTLADDKDAIRSNAAERKLGACEYAKQAMAATYEKSIDRIGRECTSKWYESPMLSFGLGVAACGVIDVGRH